MSISNIINVLNLAFSLKNLKKKIKHLPIIPDPIIELTTLKTAAD